MITPLILLWLFFFSSLLQTQQRRQLRHKSRRSWLIDGIGIAVQGAGVPLLQICLWLAVLNPLFPHLRGCLALHPVLAFCLSFVAIDYLYYWSHRLLHHPWLFMIHALHHTVSQMDMTGSSRNTVWAIFFLPYIWINGILLYIIAEPWAYSAGIFLTCFLDLWRHSSLIIPPRSRWHSLLNPWLILPQDHWLHHQSQPQLQSHAALPSPILNKQSSAAFPPPTATRTQPQTGANFGANFGANLKLWDRLHQTYQAPSVGLEPRFKFQPQPIGPSPAPKLSLRSLVWPF